MKTEVARVPGALMSRASVILPSVSPIPDACREIWAISLTPYPFLVLLGSSFWTQQSTQIPQTESFEASYP